MSEIYRPPVAFHFSVTLFGSLAPFSAASGVDGSFQEVSGIQVEQQVEEVVEGGENRFVHRLPRPARYSNLVLKRGVVTRSSVLAEWVGQTVGSSLSLPVIPQNLLVMLLDAEGDPVVVWGFVNAWPVRWETGTLDSQRNEVLTETMEFTYGYFERLVLTSPASAAVKLAQFTAKLI